MSQWLVWIIVIAGSLLLIGCCVWFQQSRFHSSLTADRKDGDLEQNLVDRGNLEQMKGRGYCQINAPWIPPRIIPDFITWEERQYILAQAEPRFEESKVVTGFDTQMRKSETAWIERDDPVISGIIRRACGLTNLPFENVEKMQVVKYGVNGFYNAHYDASCDDKPESIEFEKNGGQRVATVLIYLNDDFEGGATQFPNLNKDYKAPVNGALLFYSLQTPESGNQCHPLSLHAGMPVTKGQKCICNIWIREKAYLP